MRCGDVTAMMADVAWGGMAFAAQRVAGYLRGTAAAVDRILPEQLAREDFDLGAVRRLMIGVCNVCNARCRFCTYPRAATCRTRRSGLMAPDLAGMVLRRFHAAGGRAVDFTSVVGEPLLCPYLPELVDEARGIGMTTRALVTNGIELAKEGLPDALLDAGVTEISISTGDWDREVYARMMGTDRFGDVCEGLDALLHRNAARGWPARISVCVRNALAPSVTLGAPAWRAIVVPFGRRVEAHFTVSFDSWCGSVRAEDFLGRMRMRAPGPQWRAPCLGLFQPVVLHDGSVRVCPCRADVSEFDELVTGGLETYAERALEIAQGFCEGKRPAPCRECGFYRPVTAGWVMARRRGAGSADARGAGGRAEGVMSGPTGTSPVGAEASAAGTGAGGG